MRAALYTRVSTLDQAVEGYSLEAQRKALEAWAQVKGYTDSVLYTDAGLSGKDIKHRPEMQRMLEDIRTRGYNAVLVWSLSRLTRSVADLYSIWGKLQKNEVALLSYTESFDTNTPTGRAMMGLLGVFAQMEREITAERVSAALEERAAQGKLTCSDVLGYDRVDDRLMINEHEAERVRYIYEQYLTGKSLTEVARGCERMGYYGKRGRHFKAWHIHVILTRPIYAGYNSYHGNAYLGTHKPIISQEVWQQTQEQIALRSRAKSTALPAGRKTGRKD